MVTGISEDSVTAFYIFFLIKNYQRIRKSEPADAIFYFFRTPTIDKEPIKSQKPRFLIITAFIMQKRQSLCSAVSCYVRFALLLYAVIVIIVEIVVGCSVVIVVVVVGSGIICIVITVICIGVIAVVHVRVVTIVHVGVVTVHIVHIRIVAVVHHVGLVEVLILCAKQKNAAYKATE